MTLLEELAARVEAAQGPDRELDLSIMRYAMNIGGAASNAAHYTSSLDAAMTLVPEGATWRIDFAASRHGRRAIGSAFVISPPASGVLHNGDAATPALALTAAALRALAHKDINNG